jgi:FkbM family methyltransferase
MINRIFNRIRLKFFPTNFDKEVKRWINDGGDEELRFNYELNENSVVMDLGGYKGQWASDIYSMYNCKILIFEPVDTFANSISKRFRLNHKIKIFSHALGSSHREETIYLSENGSSVFLDRGSSVVIRFQDIKTFFEDNDITKIDLLKINIEGGEYEVLSRLIETGLINHIDNIQVQFHNIETNSRTKMIEIKSILEKTHRSTYQYEFVWENWVRKQNH